MSVTAPATVSRVPDLSPESWRDTLLNSLAARTPMLRKCENYYRGKHKMAFSTAQFREVFGALFAAFADNWCDLVVDASAERLRIEGFRFGDQPADEAAWEIWQRNHLDAESDLAHTDAIKLGTSYTLVTPDDGGKALIQIEAADKAIVYVDPAHGRHRLAGLRSWTDEWKVEHCALYLPDAVHWWRREGQNQRWADAPGSGANPLGVVPLIPLPNAPTLAERLGHSDIERVIPVQDAVNKLCDDMIVASEFAAFAQRWATGIEIPRHPETGELMTANFLGGADRVWAVESENAKFGNFQVSDLTTYVRAIEMLIQHIAAQTRTPPHYLLGQSGAFPSGESLKATETGLVAKVRRKQLSFGEGWEETIRLAFKVEGDTERADETDVETVWGNPESRMIGQTVDAAVKLATIGVPRPALWEFVGFSPQQIRRWEESGLAEPEKPPDPKLIEAAAAAKTAAGGEQTPPGEQPVNDQTAPDNATSRALANNNGGRNG